NLVFIHGLINLDTTSIPLGRVQSLRTEKGIWFRLLAMRGIIFDTIATRTEEIELILDEGEWQSLLAVIEKEEKPHSLSDAEPRQETPSSVVHFPTKNLLLASLCQNHLKGLAVLGSISGVAFDMLSNFSENANDAVAGYLDSNFEIIVGSPLRIILLLGIIYVVILILWLVTVILRYYDMTMRYDKNRLTFSYGLLTRASCSFFYDKICTIKIKRNILERKFGLCTLMLKQALFASAQKEEDNMKLYGADSSDFFLKWWLGDEYSKCAAILTARSGRGVLIHAMLPRLGLIIVLGIILYFFQLYLWEILPGLYLFYSLVRGIFLMRHSKISLRKTYFIVNNGAFAETVNYIKYSNLEVVRIRRTPLSGRFHRVSLELSTSGTTFFIRSLPEKEAKQIYEALLYGAEKFA
ncbi:MAG: PH domain-containing protein, partial [Muribaculaceae bacterium]|nr:PH domain-containing protein [Muribaculaceae bacterium]